LNVQMPCFPCFFNQALIAISLVTDDRRRKWELLKLAFDPVKEATLDETPAHIATRIYSRLRAELDGIDPFKELKRRCTNAALQMVERLRKEVAASQDPLEAAIKVSVAGNVIDFGIFSDVHFESVLADIVHNRFAVLSLEELRADLRSGKRIMFLADNAGELVFDSLLIEQLLESCEVCVGVKSVPVINDATVEDAEASSLPAGVRVIENGSDCVGTILSTCSDHFRAEFDAADLIISKGQANFETLDTLLDRNIYFLLKAKCDVIARRMGVKKDSLVAVANRLLPAVW